MKWDITVAMIKAEIIEVLQLLMNKVYLESLAPDDWQIGIIIPIYKTKDTRDCSNFRRLTLLSTVGKLYAEIMEKKIEILEKTLEGLQYGFWPNRGVTEANFIIRQISKKA